MLSAARASGFALALALVRADVVTEGTPIGSLYAYGSGISGLPVIYSDGLALLGWGRPSIASVATNVTFTHANTSLIAEPNNTAVASNWTTPLFYIETRPGALADVGFGASDTSTNNTRTSTGFDFYGRQLMWLGSDEDAGTGRSFWAVPMLDDSGFYNLFWNSDNEVVNGSVPVAIKKLPPPSLPDSK
ncbi:hypothetical protein MBLNU13_g03370t2 [Cladosporium sp. NU13]